ncbi:MAG: O-antigen ligase family protein [Phycisphaerae bacterium]
MILGMVAYVVGVVLVMAWPSLGFGLLFTIPAVKVIMKKAVPGLLTSYTYDMAVVLLVIVGALFYGVRRRRGAPLPIPRLIAAAWLLIILLLWIRLPGSHSIGYGYKKALIFSIFNTLAVATIPLYLLGPWEARKMLRILLIAGVATSVAMPLYGTGTGEWEGARVSLAGGSPLAVADLSSFGIIVLISAFIGRPSARRLALVVAAVPVCALAIWLSGTRGPVIAIPPLVLAVLWFYRREINFRAAVAALVGLSVVGGITARILDPTMLHRFTLQSFEKGFQIRINLSKTALAGFWRRPLFGNGTGDWAYQFSGNPDYEGWPHNHMFEIANELGVLGLAAWLTLVGYALRAGWSLSRREWDGSEAKSVGVPVYMGFLYGLIFSFKTGSYTASYMTYFFLIATIVLYQLRLRDKAAWQVSFWQHLTRQQQQQTRQPEAGPVALTGQYGPPPRR